MLAVEMVNGKNIRGEREYATVVSSMSLAVSPDTCRL